MIQQNRQIKQLGRRERDRLQQQAKQSQDMAQSMINAILWQIIMQSVEQEEGEDRKDGILTVPLEEMKGIPKGFKLDINMTDEAIILKACIEEKKNIILLGDN